MKPRDIDGRLPASIQPAQRVSQPLDNYSRWFSPSAMLLASTWVTLQIQFKFNPIQQQPWAPVPHDLTRLSVCGSCAWHDEACILSHHSGHLYPMEPGNQAILDQYTEKRQVCPSSNISPSHSGIGCNFVSEREVFQAGLHHPVEMRWPGMGPKHLAILNSIPEVIKEFSNCSRATGRICIVWHTAHMAAWNTRILSHTPSLC